MPPAGYYSLHYPNGANQSPWRATPPELSRPLTQRDSRQIRRDVPATPKAYEYYLRGNQAARDDSTLTIARDMYLQAIEEDQPTGLGGLMRWLSLAWRGEFEASIEVCVEASLDDRIAPSTRDLFVGIAILDHFSLTEASDDPYGLVARALDVAGRTEMALTRITCLLGVAWALADREPARHRFGTDLGKVEGPIEHALGRERLDDESGALRVRGLWVWILPSRAPDRLVRGGAAETPASSRENCSSIGSISSE